MPLGTAGHICANFATCSWELLTMLNPHFVAWEHGLFGSHKSEDIRTFLLKTKKSDDPSAKLTFTDGIPSMDLSDIRIKEIVDPEI